VFTTEVAGIRERDIAFVARKGVFV